MVKLRVLQFSFLMSILPVTLVHAYLGDDLGSSTNYCHPSYRGVKTIYLSYESGLPENKPINWDKTLKLIANRYKEVLSDEDIEFVLTDLSETKALKGSASSLYLKLFYSYVSKDALTPPVPEHVMAVWVEQTRILDDKGLKLARVIHNQSSLPLPLRADPTENPVRRKSKMWLDSFSSYENMEFSPADLSINSSFVLDEVVCGVLFSSAGKKCTDSKHFSKKTIAAVERRCIDDDPTAQP